MQFIPKAGASLTTKNVLSGAGRIKWMTREESRAPADNGWRIFSGIDTAGYLADTANLQIVDYNRLCEIEPALIGIWDFPVGTDLQLVDDDGIKILDNESGKQIPPENFYVPPGHRA
ncbi:immunity protein Imm33 domain-containing protein [Kribbella sindirgiensis]|uniref:DUF2185 domain-containing protein n=1 Tax=Kribbella sindirgiensis TaxID=1124744 RepID=A0A4R0HVU6_9ACTN|nr:DUF2185 domain-containing protein [Kribbella sindirgiensis]TCC15251.1 DUF2185 domain-containing protein [Kribbella sindirgiensis]